MFDAIKNDPAIFEITIVLIILVSVALWQKLNRTAMIMGLVYFLYLIFIVFNFVPSIEQVPTDDFQDNVVSKEIKIDPIPKVIDQPEKSEINDDGSIDNSQKSIKIQEKTKALTENSVQEKTESNERDINTNFIDSFQENRIKVVLFQTGRDIINRQLLKPDSLFNLDDRRIYCMTKIQNQNNGKTIFHKWYHEGKLRASIEMEIGRSYNWRTWSYINIRPERVGNWKVVVVDTLGISYDSLLFKIENNMIE